MSEPQRKVGLLVIDVQEDFCPPNGSLAVPDGRSVAKPINDLLTLPFALKLATKDYHPADHISFASNHPGAVAMESFVTIVNPANPDEKYESLLWPAHCVIGTTGTEIIPEVHVDKIDKIVNKGTDPRVEMYSAFRSPLRNPPLETAVSDVGRDLNAAGITDVVVTGIAGDFCVQSTARHSAEDGWKTYVVEEAVRSVTQEGWNAVKQEMMKEGIQIVSVQWIKENLF